MFLDQVHGPTASSRITFLIQACFPPSKHDTISQHGTWPVAEKTLESGAQMAVFEGHEMTGSTIPSGENG
jgi:hypothetical protein